MSVANKVSAAAAPSVATATSRVGAGRNIASNSVQRIEELSYSPWIGVNDESILHYDERPDFSGGGGRRRRDDAAVFLPMLSRAAAPVQAEVADASLEGGGGRLFLTDVLRGIGVYERNLRAIDPANDERGARLNYVY